MVNLQTNSSVSGMIFNIQQFSVHDGPGIRTLVFLKGCPLKCRWCANPESQKSYPELACNNGKCIGIDKCNMCSKVCSNNAISPSEGKININRQLCNNCGKCSTQCPSNALYLFGQKMSVDDVLKVVEEDMPFYSRSGGGITLSGGEPLMQGDFAFELLNEAKNRGLDTAIETCGYSDWNNVKKVCSPANTIFFDIKCVDSNKHEQFTGVSNELILENFSNLANHFINTNIIVRTPVIPGFNDSIEDIMQIINHVRYYQNVSCELLPYHRFGEVKYTYLGREYLLKDIKNIEKEKINTLKEIVNRELGKA
ncbi:MAG: glycyl-radical enzyme activating protein [Dehalobacterium sp.]